MPLYDTGIAHLLNGPLKNNRKHIPITTLCKMFSIKTIGLNKKKPSTKQSLEEEQMRKYAFNVTHLMTIMQEQLADKSTEEKQKIMTKIRNRINGGIETVDKSRAKSNQKKSTNTDYIVTVVVETESSKKIIQVFISL